MTAEMRRRGGKSGVSFVDIRSQCLRTRCISGVVLEDLRRGSLRAYLKCLVKVIEQQLCSLPTSSMKFSWRLPRGIYPSGAKRLKLLSSMEEVSEGEQINLIQVPMKVLDDLNVCEMRAKLRSEPYIKGKAIIHEELGKAWWKKISERICSDIISCLRIGGKILDSWLEVDLVLTYKGAKLAIDLHGRADIVTFASIECTSDSIPLIALFEFTIYREALNVIVERVIAYASALYSHYGFLVLPIIAIIKDLNDKVTLDGMFMLQNDNPLGFSSLLLNILRRLEKILLDEVRVRKAPEDLCAFCDVDLRKRCPYFK